MASSPTEPASSLGRAEEQGGSRRAGGAEPGQPAKANLFSLLEKLEAGSGSPPAAAPFRLPRGAGVRPVPSAWEMAGWVLVGRCGSPPPSPPPPPGRKAKHHAEVRAGFLPPCPGPHAAVPSPPRPCPRLSQAQRRGQGRQLSSGQIRTPLLSLRIHFFGSLAPVSD